MRFKVDDGQPVNEQGTRLQYHERDEYGTASAESGPGPLLFSSSSLSKAEIPDV